MEECRLQMTSRHHRPRLYRLPRLHPKEALLLVLPVPLVTEEASQVGEDVHLAAEYPHHGVREPKNLN